MCGIFLGAVVLVTISSVMSLGRRILMFCLEFLLQKELKGKSENKVRLCDELDELSGVMFSQYWSFLNFWRFRELSFS